MQPAVSIGATSHLPQAATCSRNTRHGYLYRGADAEMPGTGLMSRPSYTSQTLWPTKGMRRRERCT